MKQRRIVVHEPEVPDVDLDVQMWDEMPDDHLGVPDDLGWAPIHHAAQKGVLHIIERAVVYNNQLLEQKTVDVSAITPLLIAVQVNSSSPLSSFSFFLSASLSFNIQDTSRRRLQPSAPAFIIVGLTDCPTNATGDRG